MIHFFLNAARKTQETRKNDMRRREMILLAFVVYKVLFCNNKNNIFIFYQKRTHIC